MPKKMPEKIGINPTRFGELLKADPPAAVFLLHLIEHMDSKGAVDVNKLLTHQSPYVSPIVMRQSIFKLTELYGILSPAPKKGATIYHISKDVAKA